MIYGIMAAAYGILIGVQSAFCAQITQAYGNWFSSVIVHLGGFLVLTPLFFTKWGRKQGSAPWYLYLGGTLGFVNVLFSNYGIVSLGITNSNALMFLGEIVFAAGLDSLGALGSRKRPITPMKRVAIVIVLAGVLTIPLLSGGNMAAFAFLAVVASLMRGVITVVFRQLNGQLGLRCGTGFSTYLNYVTGLAAAVLAFCLLGFPMEASFPAAEVPVWAYLCGVFGCCGIFLCNLASPRLSVLTMSLVGFLCQTGTGMVFDLLWGRLSVPTVVGCAIVTVGMVVNLLAESKESR